MSRQGKKKNSSGKMEISGDIGRPPVPKPRPGRTMISRSEKETLRQLFTCVEENDINCVREALENGFDVKQEYDISHDTLLSYSSSGSVEMTTLLLKYGSNINHVNRVGMTPLLIALLFKKYDIAKLFIERGADINISDKKGNTPLMISIMYNNIETFKQLIYRGADIGIQNSDGNTVLMISIIYDNIETTEQLLARGADIGIQNSDGDTALTIAARFQYDDIVKLLLDHGGNVITITDSKYYKKYIDMDSDYYAFCKKFASPKYELNRKTIRRKRRKIISEIKTELSIAGDLDNLEQINDFFEKLTPEYILIILNKIDNEFFNGKIFPMFEKNGCCVTFCLDKCINLGAAGECSMDRDKNIKIVIDKDIFINFFERNGYIRDELEPCEGLLACLLQTIEHEFLHGIMYCGCSSYGNSSIMPPGIEPVRGLEYRDDNGHSKIFMRILYNRFGQQSFYHGLYID